MVIAINKITSIDTVGSARVLYSQKLRWPRRPPLPAFDGQDVSWAKTALIGGESVPPTDLQMITIEDASFVIGGGYDGLLLTKDRMCIAESRLFSTAWDQNHSALEQFEIPVEPAAQKLGDVFLGFDAAWANYFHWLCFAIARIYIAARIVPDSCAIIIPDYIAHASNPDSVRRRRLGYSEEVWRQSLDLADLSNRVLPLPAGLYKAQRVHMIWPAIRSPTELLNADLFYRVFSEIRAKLKPHRTMRNRIFISRNNAPDTRMNAADHRALEENLESRGFTTVALETLPFIQQVELFHNAEIVVAPHGAGLANIVFGSDSLKVFELNRRIGADKALRPWYYMISSQRNLRYSYLDGTNDGFPIGRVTEGIDRLL